MRADKCVLLFLLLNVCFLFIADSEQISDFFKKTTHRKWKLLFKDIKFLYLSKVSKISACILSLYLNCQYFSLVEDYIIYCYVYHKDIVIERKKRFLRFHTKIECGFYFSNKYMGPQFVEIYQLKCKRVAKFN